ncbi:RNA polymerase sigma-70 factor [Reichenbachiella agarivorans]|uniref:RNA polymerase sigma-70 factor n=1 Tax=Reichenbachiella agarivorans TaxID=2979464 RepID=A0ABY6CR69_9BACT|nr:RNA polymerase sigma-70 factor [Reichenbachiella agarivorans]UXP31958.1 RNA polymerase sigma-70 factor [Reichenbachiella agarivorans]
MESIYDPDLLLSLRQGDVEAFETLYHRYWKPLYIHAYKRVSVAELAEEIVQDVFCQLWEKRKQVDVAVSVEAYLYGSVRNHVLRHFRDQYRHETHHQEIKNQSLQHNDQLERSMVQKDLLEKVEELIEMLPDKSKHVFELSRKHFLTNREIALRMGVTDKTVEYHINYSLQYLRSNCPDYLLVSLFFYTMAGTSA